RREHHDCRVAVLAASTALAANLLTTFVIGHPAPGVFVGRKPFGRPLKIAFLYGDQTERWKSLVPALAAANGFASAAADVAAACQRVHGWPLASVTADDARWNDPAWARSALVALQMVLTAWWRQNGIAPDVVMGQGIGELSAAAAAGILTPDDVLQLVKK